MRFLLEHLDNYEPTFVSIMETNASPPHARLVLNKNPGCSHSALNRAMVTRELTLPTPSLVACAFRHPGFTLRAADGAPMPTACAPSVCGSFRDNTSLQKDAKSNPTNTLGKHKDLLLLIIYILHMNDSNSEMAKRIAWSVNTT